MKKFFGLVLKKFMVKIKQKTSNYLPTSIVMNSKMQKFFVEIIRKRGEWLIYSKPNPNFFKEILEENKLKADEVIFFGNSAVEDSEPASKIGIKTFLVNNNGIKFEEIKNIIKNEIKNNN